MISHFSKEGYPVNSSSHIILLNYSFILRLEPILLPTFENNSSFYPLLAVYALPTIQTILQPFHLSQSLALLPSASKVDIRRQQFTQHPYRLVLRKSKQHEILKRNRSFPIIPGHSPNLTPVDHSIRFFKHSFDQISSIQFTIWPTVHIHIDSSSAITPGIAFSLPKKKFFSHPTSLPSFPLRRQPCERKPKKATLLSHPQSK
ncbi:hypothetical protein EYC80_004072 [Monilinia laxa]|uniref:Uncharacterized protein n=1 Tax=Monilinia laxa TaxID=61186 RepID=A0A5N6KM10_MONLA|nr:hypothetical protein EYC80_004072 [Monilinia laxa]